jgi:hypothetical protein
MDTPLAMDTQSSWTRFAMGVPHPFAPFPVPWCSLCSVCCCVVLRLRASLFAAPFSIVGWILGWNKAPNYEEDFELGVHHSFGFGGKATLT